MSLLDLTSFPPARLGAPSRAPAPPAASPFTASGRAAPEREVTERKVTERADRRPLAVDRLDAVDAAAHRDAWIDLVGRALEPNAFLDPDFALPAVQHLAGGRRPCFVLVWAEARGPGAGPRELVAVWPVVGRRGPLRGLASAWIHDLATLGLPLLDRDRADAALAALLDWAERDLKGAAGLLIPSLPADGPTAAALRRAAAARGGELAILDVWERAMLRPDRADRQAGLAALSPKAAKELRRQRRRLEERGSVAFASAEGDAVRAEVERFLSLEAGGWKGAAGTAMLSSAGRTAFLRAVTRLLAARGLCRVETLALDGAPVAAAVVLSAGGSDCLWKIAYREDVARFSPGVQLVLDVTAARARDGRGGAMDSCAVPDHPMIDRLWKDRLRLCDAALALPRSPRRGSPRGGEARFRRALRVERAARRLRAEAKRLVLAWRARRAGRAA